MVFEALTHLVARGRALHDPVTGQILLYPPGDLDQLSDRCEMLLSDPTSGETVGETAARQVLEKYTWDSNVSRVIEIVQSTRDRS